MGRTRTRKKGTMNASGTKKWDGTKWVPVNVARDGQRATRNGKPVVRKNGEWVPVRASTRSTNRRSSSGNKPTSKPALKNIPASKRPADMQAGKVYGELPTIPASKRPKDMQAGKVYGDAGQPPAPKLPPKPKPRVSTTVSSTSTKKPAARKAQSKDMDANYKAWAKANPTLAKKVKKGQAGYKAVNSTSTKPKPAAGTGNHRGAGNGAPGAQRASLKTTPTKATPPKTKPTKPLAVPTNQIPKNLNSPAGRKYIADLDAGKLTRKRK